MIARVVVPEAGIGALRYAMSELRRREQARCRLQSLASADLQDSTSGQ
jgi:hypothetical protein